MAICAIYGCDTSNEKSRRNRATDDASKYKLFRFPRDPKMAKIWEEKCGRRDRVNPRTAFICSKHFTKEHYVRNLQYELLNYWPKNARHLKADAEPTEDLPFPSKKRKNDVKRNERADRRNLHASAECMIKPSTSSEYHSVEYLDEAVIKEEERAKVKELEEKPAKDTAAATSTIEKKNYQVETVYLDESTGYIHEAVTEETAVDIQEEADLREITPLPHKKNETNRKRKGTNRRRKIKREFWDELTDTEDAEEAQGTSQEEILNTALELELEELISFRKAEQKGQERKIGRLEGKTDQVEAKSRDVMPHVNSNMNVGEHLLENILRTDDLPHSSSPTNVEQKTISKRKKRSPKRDYKALIENLNRPKSKSPEVTPNSVKEDELKETILKQQGLIKTLREENQTMNYRILKLTHENFVLRKELSAVDKIFSPTQRKKMRLGVRVQWTAEDMSKCSEIYRQSSRAYKFLLREGYPFPAVITIIKHVANAKRQSKRVGCEPLLEVGGQGGVTGEVEVNDQTGLDSTEN